MKLTEHNEKVLNQFSQMMIKRMEQVKASDYQQGWLGAPKGGAPVNFEARPYHGGNVFLLMLCSYMLGYDYPIYTTLKQANRLGAHVNKGEKALPVLFWDFTVRTPEGRKLTQDEYKAMDRPDREACSVRPFLKTYAVFNIAQTNLSEVKPDKVSELQKLFKLDDSYDEKGMYSNDRIDTMLAQQTWLCPIHYERPSDRAFYNPSLDQIVIPAKAQFKRHRKRELIYADGQEYYETLLHEMIHSTGAESRLNRNEKGRFGSPAYAKEELIAELGAALVGSELGFNTKVIKNSAAYIDSWIKVLQEEPTFILTILCDVEKAAQMIMAKL